MVRPGSYSGTGNRQINFNGKSLRLVSEAGPLQTIVDCGQGRIAILNNAENSSTLIRGFTFRNAYVNQSGDWATAVLFEMSNSSPVIENCIFRDNRAEGTFHTGTSGATILSSGSGRPTVRNCLFYNNTVKSGDNATGADLIRGDYQLIENCTIANNTIDAFMINWWYYITKSVLRVFALNSTTAVRNCVVWGNTISEIGPRSERSPRTEPLSQPTASHTLFQGTLQGTNIINVDPRFRDAAGGDFGLLAGSPAKDTGDPASTPDPDGTRADMGYFVAKSGGNAATVPFADNFESGSLGSSWNISSTRGNGFVRVNSTRPQAGTNSLNMGITSITSPQNSSSSDVSLKFDRALAQGVIELDLFVERSSRHYTYLVLEAAGQWSAGAALTDFQNTINPGWWQSTTVSTNLPRSDGWARFKWIVDGDNVELKVNGTTAAKGKSHGPVTGLSLVLQSVQSNVQTYIDNVRVTDSLAGENTEVTFATDGNLYAGVVGVAFSNVVTASGSAPITFGASNLPVGLTISTNGVITGTPTTAGTNIVVLSASNAYGAVFQTNHFRIDPAASLSIYSLRVRAHIDGPSQLILSSEGIRWHHWDWTAVPGRHEGRDEPTYLNDVAWYPLWPQPGENRNYDAYSSYFTGFDLSPFLSGQPVSLQLVRARDSVSVSYELSGGSSLTIVNYDDLGWGGSDDYEVLLTTLGGQTPAFTTNGNYYTGAVGVAFSNVVTASGSTPITFACSNLPAGLTISTNGVIAGTPTAAGTNEATLTASNAFGVTNRLATFAIGRGTPAISNWPTASSIFYGQALSNSVLAGGSANVDGSFAWTAPTNIPAVGTNSYNVTFTPSSTNNYTPLSSNIIVLVTSAQQPAWYVSTNGSDSSGTGGAQSPFATIQKAVDVATDGGAVVVLPGNYSGPGNRAINLRGKSIVVTSLNGPDATVLDLGRSQAFLAHSTETTNTVINGFTMTNGYVQSSADWDGDSIVSIRGNAALTVRSCVFKHNETKANYVTTSMRIIEGRNLSVVDNCLFFSNTVGGGGWTPYAGGGAWVVNGDLVTRCTIVSNTIYSSVASWSGYNGGIRVALAGGLLKDNLVWGNSPSFWPSWSGFPNTTAQTHAGSSNSPASYSLSSEGVSGYHTINTILTNAPTFVSPGTGNFALSVGSPGVDAADPSSPLDADGSRADVGYRADRFVSLQQPSGTPPSITSTNSYTGMVGAAFSNVVTASGSTPMIFGASNLPAGLTISTNGVITGIPTTVGTNTTILTASNAFGLAVQSADFIIDPASQRPNSFLLQSAQAGSTTDIDNLRVVDLDTGAQIYSNSFATANDATNNLELFYWPQGGDSTTNFIRNGSMTRIVDGKLRLETTGFNANGAGGYESHSEAEWSSQLPRNFLIEFDATRLQWAGHFHFHVFRKESSDALGSSMTGGAFSSTRSSTSRLDVVRMAASGSWFQQYGVVTNWNGAQGWAVSFPAPPGSLQNTHKLGVSLSNSTLSFYLNGVLLNSTNIPSLFSDNSRPQITSTNYHSGTVGVAFSNIVTARGGIPITFGASNLPAGLTISTNGLITGVPTAVGTNTVTLTASNAYGVADQSATFVILPLDPAGDQDGDGVTNYREEADGTDPHDPASFHSLSKGLLAYYPLDENTEDYSGRRWHAVNYGAAPVAGRSGDQQSAYVFNGSSAYMDTPVDSNLPRLTISAWFRADSTAGERSIVDSDIGGNYGHSLILGYGNGDNTLDVQYHNGSFDSGWSPSPGAWHHAVAVYEPGLVTLYVDGTLKGQWSYSGAAPDGSNFRLGRHNATDPQWFKGGIDDVRIYDRALTGEEIGALYQQEIGTIDSDGDGLTDTWERGFGRYQAVSGSFSWHAAKLDAESRGGHLATVSTPDEWQTIKTYLVPSKSFWLGGSDAQAEGDWRWVDGSRWLFSAWYPSQPDNAAYGQPSRPQNYLLTSSVAWDDRESADVLFPYILEFGYPTDPHKADTDGDGYDDKAESDAGTDPNDPTAYPGDDDVAGPPPSGLLMTDVTSFASTMPEHGLIAVLDYDNDGLDDLLVETGQGVRLWRSRGPFDFQDVTSAAGLDGITPAVVADFNNDGLADILSIDAARTSANVFANNGQGSFAPHAVPSAIAADLAAYRDIQSADIDNDGDLDLLYAVNPSFGGGAVAALFNTSSGGNLSFGTKTYLVRTSWIYAKFDSTDANGDGKTDLVVLQTNGSWPNDTHPNHPASLYLNTGSVPGDYANPDGSRMLAGFTEKAGCGIDSGNEMSRFTSWDMDNDGDLDLINGSSDWPWVSRPHVYLNNGAGTYTQQDSPVYQSGNYYHHGITIFDADLDNDLDAVWTGLHNFANIYPRMWENLSGGSFQDSTSAWGVTASIPGSGNLGSGGYAADLDGDGDQDFVVQGWNGWGPEKYFRIYRNDANVRGSKWLKVELVGLVSPAQGRGARVEVIVGGKKLVQYLGHDVGGMATTTLHFGLGGNSAAASVKVYWPSGAVSELANVTANQVLQITEDSAADDVIPPVVTVGPDPADNAIVRTPQITFTGGVAEDRGFPVLEYRRADQTWQQIPLLSSTNPFAWQQTVSLEASAVTSVLLAPGHAWEYTFNNPTSDVVLWNAAVGSGNGWSRGPAPFGNVRNGGDFDYATYWPEDPYDWNPALWDDDLWVRTTVDLTHVDLNSVRWFMGVDNGYKLYVNGVLVSANNAEHYTWKWEYSGDFGAALVQGVNVIAVALEDHGGLTAFDMEITGRSLLPGVNTFEFRARDEAGNVSDSVFRTVRYVPDSDGDGVIDYREIKDGTDPANPSSFNPFSKDLLAYYPFSGTAEDESGYANHFLSPPQFGADRSGLASKAASFSEPPPIETPATRLPASGYTISTWIKLDRLPSEVGERMLMHGSWNAGSGAFSIATWSDLAVAFSWRAANGAQSEIRSDSGILSLGKWHQVTCAVSPSETRMFVNGQLLEAKPSEIASFLAPLVCGGDDGYFFDSGSLDEIRIYERALADSEVQALYVEELGDIVPPVLTLAPEPADGAVIGQPSATYSGTVKEMSGQPTVEVRPAGAEVWTQVPLGTPAIAFPWDKLPSGARDVRLSVFVNGVPFKTYDTPPLVFDFVPAAPGASTVVFQGTDSNGSTTHVATLTYPEDFDLQPVYPWSSTVALSAGTNSFQFRARDTVGNVSAIITRNLSYTIPPTYSVAVLTTAGGSVSPDTSNQEFIGGSVLQFSAQAQEGFEFLRWTGFAQGTNNPLSLTITNNTTLGAVFTRLEAPDASPSQDYTGASVLGTGPSGAAVAGANATAGSPDGSFVSVGDFAGSFAFSGETLSALGSRDGFVVKHGPYGAPQWCATFGAARARVQPTCVAVDGEGRITVAGTFTGTVDFGSGPVPSRGGSDVFVARLSANGEFVWAVTAGGSANESLEGMISSPSGHVFVTGAYVGSDCRFGTNQMPATLGADAYLARVTPGGDWSWVRGGGGASSDSGTSLALGPDGLIWWGGNFQGSLSLGQSSVSSAGGSDMFVSAVQRTDGAPVSLVRFGGPSADKLEALAADGDGGFYAAGGFTGSLSAGAESVFSAGGMDGFVARYQPNVGWTWLSAFSGENEDMITSLTTDDFGRVYVAGYFDSAALSAGSSNCSNAFAMSSDAFVGRLSGRGEVKWLRSFGGEYKDLALGLAHTALGGLQIVGYAESGFTVGEYAVPAPAGYADAYFVRVGGASSQEARSVNVSAGPGGFVELQPEGSNFPLGTLVEITALPNTGYAFSGWGGDAEGTANPYSFIVERSVSIRASFADIAPPTIDIQSPAADGGSKRQKTRLAGRVTDNGQVASATWSLNGAAPQNLPLDSNGNFDIVNVSLAEGENTIVVEALDVAGNLGTALRNITWSAERSFLLPETSQVKDGQKISIPVRLTSGGEVGGFSLLLTYDPAVFTNPGFSFSGPAVQGEGYVTADVGSIRVVYSGAGQGIVAGTHLIGEINLRARTVPAGARLDSLVDLQVLDASDAAGQPLDGGTAESSCLVTVSSRGKPGDANGNGNLDAGDAAVMKGLIATPQNLRPWDSALSDLNSSGGVDSGDLTKLLRIVAGLDEPPADFATPQTRSLALSTMTAFSSASSQDVVNEPYYFDREGSVPVEVRVTGDLDDNQIVAEVIVPASAPSLNAAQFVLSYPAEVIELVSWEKGSAAPAETLIYATGPGTLAFVASDNAAWAADGGVLLRVVLRPKNIGATVDRKLVTLGNLKVFTGDGYEAVITHQRPGRLQRKPEEWIAEALGASVNPDSDDDKDGFTNRQEYSAGTNPRDSSSVFKLTGFSHNASTRAQQLIWNAVYGVKYRIVSSENLRDWLPVSSTDLVGNEGVVAIDVQPPLSSKKLFYRVQVID